MARDAPAEDEMSDVTDELSYLPVIDAPDLMAAIVKAAGLALAATSEDGDDGEQSEAEQPHVVHFDAVASVRAAFTVDEMRRLVAEAGIEGAEVEHAFPQRMRISWRTVEAGSR